MKNEESLIGDRRESQFLCKPSGETNLLGYSGIQQKINGVNENIALHYKNKKFEVKDKRFFILHSSSVSYTHLTLPTNSRV